MAEKDELLDAEVVNTSEIKAFDFPLLFEFKVTSMANDFVAKDKSGTTLAYVRQKMFKFKEDVQVFSDQSKKRELFRIKADRWLDYNANYAFTNAEQETVGRVGRKGRKSILKAHYEIFDVEGNQEFFIQEENPWAKFWDFLMSEIPVIGMFTGYMFNPRYIIKRVDGTDVARLSKEASFFGRKFRLEKLNDIDKGEDERLMLGLMMMSLLERRRG